MVVSLTYAVTVNFVPYYRIPADMVGDSQIGIAHDRDEQNSGADQIDRLSGSDLEKNLHVGNGVEDSGINGANVEQVERVRSSRDRDGRVNVNVNG